MTARLHQLTATTEKKDFELNELRRTIDKLKQAGCDAGLLKDQVCHGRRSTCKFGKDNNKFFSTET